MTTGVRITNVLTVALLAVGLAGVTVGPASAGPITITNGDFEDPAGIGLNGNAGVGTIPGWMNSGEYIINPDGGYAPAGSTQTAYLSGDNSTMYQDLGHLWAAAESFTLTFTAFEAGWQIGLTGHDLTVQLRETDNTVVWSSGVLNVDGTLTAGSPPTYTSAALYPAANAHLFSFNIDASTFAGMGGTETSELRIHFGTSGGSNRSTFVDDVTLEVVDPPATPGTLIYGK